MRFLFDVNVNDQIDGQVPHSALTTIRIQSVVLALLLTIGGCRVSHQIPFWVLCSFSRKGTENWIIFMDLFQW